GSCASATSARPSSAGPRVAPPASAPRHCLVSTRPASAQSRRSRSVYVASCARLLIENAPSVSSSLELHVLVRGRIAVIGDEPEARFGDPRAVAVQECGLEERRVHRLLVHELLAPVQE